MTNPWAFKYQSSTSESDHLFSLPDCIYLLINESLLRVLVVPGILVVERLVKGWTGFQSRHVNLPAEGIEQTFWAGL